ncbi:MAG TPA: XdhC family protein [Micromonosporaceae bacterium]|nr:XdhC family protein [Micromonosporaceae bacterium]
MYEITLTVSACLRAGTQVNVAWAIEAQGFGPLDKGEALAVTPGGGRVGTVIAGALNDQIVDLTDQGVTGQAVRLVVGDLDAQLAGLAHGGDARCLLVRATDLPAELWDRLADRDPVCLVTRLDGDRVLDTTLFGADDLAGAGEDAARLFSRGVSDTLVTADTVVTVLWPVPKLVIVGVGPMTDALRAAAELLGWHTQVVNQASAATGVIAGLAALDKVVVAGHDDDLAGPALAAALGGRVGYIGALGSRRVQQSRADWLAYRGVTDLSRIHGPAGLDIGANTPAEIAVSVVAEAIAVRATATAAP